MAERAATTGSTRRPELQEVIRVALEAGLGDVFTLLPGAVTKYDGKTKVSVKPLIMRPFADEDDNRKAEELPVVDGVPVVFFGSGPFRVTVPIYDGSDPTKPATTGALCFSFYSLDKWLSGQGQIVDPQIDHTHNITDGVFFPGLRAFGNTWQTFPDHMSLGHDTGKLLHLQEQLIIAGDIASAQFVALANLVKDRLDQIQGAYDGHKHSTPSGTSGTPDTPIGTLDPVAAAVLKGE